MSRKLLIGCLAGLLGCVGGPEGDLDAPASVIAIVCQSPVLRFDTGERARSQSAACEIPVPGAAIVLESADGSTHRFESGDDGRVEFEVADIESVTAVGIYGSAGFSALRLTRDPPSDDSLLVAGENRWSIGLPAELCEPPDLRETGGPK